LRSFSFRYLGQRVVLREVVYEPDPDDVYTLKAVEQYRELSLVDGVYTVKVWRKLEAATSRAPEWIVHTEVVPSSTGKSLNAIPFFWVTPLGQTSRIDKPPLLGMVDLSIEHYRLSADLNHGLHFIGLPTFFVTGAINDEPVVLGSASAILLKDAQAKCGFAEFQGRGLGALERAIADKEQQMAALGAAILGAEMRRPETAEAARLRHGGETSLLSSTVSAVQSSLQSALQFAAEWAHASGEVKIELNDDFVSTRLDPQTLLGLVQAYQIGALTLSSLLQAMQDGDLLPQKAVITDEVASLSAPKP
jgi:hypothetical protein